jgi:hypothetical protein
MRKLGATGIALIATVLGLGCGTDRGDEPKIAEDEAASTVFDPGIQYQDDGPVLNGSIPVYVLFFGSFTAKQQSLATDFLNHLGASHWYAIVRNYTDLFGDRPTGLHVVQVATASGEPLTDASLENLFAGSFGSVDPNAIYLAFSGPGGGNPAGCGYHAYRAATNRVYAWVPYASGSYAGCINPSMLAKSPNNDPGLDEMVAAAAHELAEAATDAQPASGWYSWKIIPGSNPPASYGEIADFCPTIPLYCTDGTLPKHGSCAGHGAPASIHLGTHDYLLQSIWLQETPTRGACALANPCFFLPTAARRTACYIAATAGATAPGHLTPTIPVFAADDFNPSPIGYLDTATCDSITGWSEDPDTADSPINVNVYIDGPEGVGQGPYPVTADGDRRTDLEPVIGYGYHGFTLATPAAFHDGRTHTVYAYGTDSYGGGDTLLTDAPKSFTCINHPPDGYIDPPAPSTCGLISGWARDIDSPGEAVQVDVYVDGVFQGTTTASGARPGDGMPPWSLQLGLNLEDGQSHAIAAYVHDTWDGSAHLLGTYQGSDHMQCCGVGNTNPTCDAAPRGYLDQAHCDTISGWALDDSSPGASINVDLYFGGPAGSGAPGVRVLANISRPDVGGNYGFSYPMPDWMKDGVERLVYAYGIDTWGGYNPLLALAPKSAMCVPGMTHKRGVQDMTSYTTYWHLDLNSITVSDNVIDSYTTGDALPYSPTLFKANDGSAPVYVLDTNNVKRGITSQDSFNAWHFAWHNVQTWDASFVYSLPSGPAWPNAPVVVQGGCEGCNTRYILDY